MDLNLFIRQIVVHDTGDPAPGPGEYEVFFTAVTPGDGGQGRLYRSERWQGSVIRGEHYEVLLWVEGIAAPAGASLTVYGQGIEHDPGGDDTLLGGIAVVDPQAETGSGRWLRTTNGKHFDFAFALTPIAGGHAARPPWTDRTHDAPGPADPSAGDYPG
jgi:hypothetical protein